MLVGAGDGFWFVSDVGGDNPSHICEIFSGTNSDVFDVFGVCMNLQYLQIVPKLRKGKGELSTIEDMRHEYCSTIRVHRRLYRYCVRRPSANKREGQNRTFET